MRFELPIKRMYLPGTKVKSKCPKCSKEQVWDGDTNYLFYPVVGAPEKVYFHCDEGHEEDYAEWFEKIRLSITVEVL